METTLGKILESAQTLAELREVKGLKSTTAYRIAKIVNKVGEEVKLYEEQRTAICEKYVKKDDDGIPVVENGAYDIPEEKLLDFAKEVAELQDEKVALDIKKITLEDIENVGLSAAQLERIEFMLDTE